MKYNWMFLILIFMFSSVYSQTEILERYIKEGIANNLALKQKEFSLKKSIAALDEARGMFFPSIGVNARYTRAGGGRAIEFPVGDLVNPINGGLNQLMGANVYPTNIPNEEINFLREKEHETKISLVQPLFQPQIFFNYKLKNNLVDIQKAEKKLYTRKLIADIRAAYFNYQKTIKVVELFNEVESLLEENLRVSNSLLKNDKVTKDVVYRAEAELSEVNQKKAEAVKNKKLAQHYFNFLLNKSLDRNIEVEMDIEWMSTYSLPLEELVANALKTREEFTQLNSAIEAAGYTKYLAQSNYYPSVILAADYGYQGEEYKFNNESDYWMASLVLKWNLFNGFQDKAKAEQAEYEKQKLSAQLMELQKKVALQVTEKYEDFQVSLEVLETARKRVKSAKEAFKIVNKKYKEGMVSLVEFIDAKTAYTEASVNKIITDYDLVVKTAELDFVTGMDEAFLPELEIENNN